MKNYTEKEILDAISGSGAIMTGISNRLECDWHTAKKHIEKYESCKQALLNEREKTLDLAESVLYTSIKGGNTQDAKWLLSTVGKKRGFTEKTEIDHNLKEVPDSIEIKLVKTKS